MPLWAGAGVDARRGGFHEGLTLEGAPHEASRRARVQARQAFVYASAAAAGLQGPWLPVAHAGFAAFRRRYQRTDGLFVCATNAEGAVRDETCFLYEQAFALLAMAALHRCGEDLTEAASRVRAVLGAYRHPAGGFRELGPHPFQANAQMHLFETALAWEDAGQADWASLADEIAELALTRFIDPEGAFLREFFDEGWRPASGDDGRWVEPGHQFEWAWLLKRWGARRDRPEADAAARRLFDAGLRGVDRARGVAVNVLWDDLSVRDASARLWPQTEYLKAALILHEEAEALTAAQGLARYLDAPVRGVWRDKMRPDGSFIEEPAPASSFYHLATAILELRQAV